MERTPLLPLPGEGAEAAPAAAEAEQRMERSRLRPPQLLLPLLLPSRFLVDLSGCD
jgi:hypothetical protein